MLTKKRSLLALLLTLVLMVSGMTFASAEESTDTYRLGDKVEDFTVTLSDGSEVNLYSLLAEKKVVLLNFWASWCNPCCMEFPYLQETYDQISADIGVIALSIYNGDTDEAIEEFKAAHGVTTLPLGRDIGLASQYGVSSYPTSVIIDRNGVICLVHVGMVTSSAVLTNALKTFTADDYDKPVLLDEMPSLTITASAASEELSAALNAEDGALNFESLENSDNLWPFIPSADGTCAVASNTAIESSISNVAADVDVKAGDVLVYDLRMDGKEYDDRMIVFVNNTVAALHTSAFDWTTHALRFDADGTQTVAFAYYRGTGAGYDSVCELRNVRLLTGDEAAAYEFPVSTAPKTLEGSEFSMEFAEPDSINKILFTDETGVPASDQAVAYVANADTVLLKLRIGADVDEKLAAVSFNDDLTSNHTTMLTSLEHDDDGYFCTVDLSTASALTMVSFKGDITDSNALSSAMVICKDKESAKSYIIGIMGSMLKQLTAEQLAETSYFSAIYEDGTLITDSDDIIASISGKTAVDTAPEKLSFAITFTDASGNPVPGVMAQICDDTTCTVLPSDASGVVNFEGENHSYELHVLVAPEGYSAPEGTISLPDAGGDVSIILESAAQ